LPRKAGALLEHIALGAVGLAVLGGESLGSGARHVVVALVAREPEPPQRVALRFAGMTDRDAFRAALVAAACLLNAAVDPQAELARDRIVREAEQLMAWRHRHPSRKRAIGLAQDGAVKTCCGRS